MIEILNGLGHNQLLVFLGAELGILLLATTCCYIYFKNGVNNQLVYMMFGAVAGVILSYMVSPLLMHNPPSAPTRSFDPGYEDSFPSQHTALVAGAAAGAMSVKRTELSSVRAGRVLVIVALLTGFTRVLSGDHWPIDVAASWLLYFPIKIGLKRASNRIKLPR